MSSFLAALRFLTIVKLPGKQADSPDVNGKSTLFFPVVGLLIGIASAVLNIILRYILPQPVVSVLIITFMAVISGFLHLDGFIDTCDGMAGHKTPEERLKIMKDTHPGAFGVAGGILLLLLKYAALNSLPTSLLTGALLLAPVLSRWAVVYAILACPCARTGGLGSSFKQGAYHVSFLVATMITLTSAVMTAGVAGMVTTAAVWLITVVFASYYKKKLTGLTGDTYGAINEIAEVSVFIIVSMLARLNLSGWFGVF